MRTAIVINAYRAASSTARRVEQLLREAGVEHLAGRRRCAGPSPHTRAAQ